MSEERATPFNLVGTITIRTRTRLVEGSLVPTTGPVDLRGAQTNLWVSAGFAPAALSPQPFLLSGRIELVARALSASAPINDINLFGTITLTTAAAIIPAQPRADILVGRIVLSVKTTLAVTELELPLPPYPAAFPTQPLDYYLGLITSEHSDKPRYVATVGFNIEPYVSDQLLVSGMAGLFDLDYAIGEQEDYTGQWIGKSRWIEIPNAFFTWDQEGVGWNQANWRGPLDSDDKLQRLDDYHYKLLLYATVIANHWNGSIPAAYEAWDTLFHYAGITVLIQDYGNMSMLYGILSANIIDTVLISLFTTGQMDLRPEGIKLLYYAFQAEPGAPFFAWDAQSDSVGGWDSGSWGVMVPPGSSYIPLGEKKDGR